MEKTQVEGGSNRLFPWLNGIAIGIAILAFISYIPGLRIIGTFSEGSIPMAPSTGICFILLSLAIIHPPTLPSRRSKFMMISTILVLLFCFLEVLGFIINKDLNFEDYLIPIDETLGVIPVGRMSVSTGFFFLVAGIAVLGVLKVSKLNRITGILGLSLIFSSIVFIIAYLFDTPLMYNLESVIPMALTTAIAFFFLGVSIIFQSEPSTIPRIYFKDNPTLNRMMISFLPLNIVSNLIIAFIFLYFSMNADINTSLLISFLLIIITLITSILVLINASIISKSLDREKSLNIEINQKLERKLEEIKLISKFPESNPNPVMRISTEGKVVYHNKASTKILETWGFSEGFLKSQKILNLFKSVKSVPRNMIFDVKVFDILYSVSLVSIKDTQFLNVYALDITKRENVIQELIQSKNQYFNLYNNLADGYAYCKIIKDSKGNPIDFKYIDINPAFTKILGITREMCIGKLVSELFPTIRDEPTDWIGLYGEVANGGKPKMVESYFEALDMTNSVYIYSPEPNHFVTVFRDITKSVKATQDLIESKNQYFELFNNMLDGYAYHKIITDSNGIPIDYEFININPSFTKLTGITPEMSIGKRITKIFPTIRDEPTDWIRIYGEVAVNGKSISFESFFESLQKHFAISAYRPEPNHFVTVFRDITESVKAKEDLKQLNESLELRVKERTEDLNELLNQETLYKEQLLISSQFKSEFMASMSHELRTPLNSIIGFTDVILERISGEINERQEKYLKNVKTSAMHLLDLINDVLDISKIEAGKMELHVEDINLSKLLKKVDIVVKPMYTNKNLKFEITKIDKKKVIKIDSRRFMEILYNLLSNAIKYTKEGGVKLKISENKDEWEFNIIDTGIGIAKEDYDLIFKEFRRINSEFNNSIEGTGLGLPLTKKLIEIHGGLISFTSELGKGSTFTFTIPKK
jgi:signal transduction histidine kinase